MSSLRVIRQRVKRKRATRHVAQYGKQPHIARGFGPQLSTRGMGKEIVAMVGGRKSIFKKKNSQGMGPGKRQPYSYNQKKGGGEPPPDQANKCGAKGRALKRSGPGLHYDQAAVGENEAASSATAMPNSGEDQKGNVNTSQLKRGPATLPVWGGSRELVN